MSRTGHVLIVTILIGSCFGAIIFIAHENVEAYTPHDPISINGDANFTEQAENMGWPGDGTEGDPYVIEGYEINETVGIWDAIRINSTNVHFIIRELKINLGWISLIDVENGTIANCSFEISSIGIYLFSSNYNKIHNNFISGVSTVSIGIWDSIGNEIINNTMSEGKVYLFGTRLEHWNTHTITQSNTVNGKLVYYLKNQNGGRVPDDAAQVILANCSDIRVKDLEFTDSYYGISLGYSSYNHLNNLSTVSNRYYGIYLYHSDNNVITNCTSAFNWNGIFLSHSDWNNITGNVVHSNDRYGIRLDFSENNTVMHNEASDNMYGIQLEYSNGNRIFGNNASHTERAGIFLENSHRNNVSNNIATFTEDAISLNGSNENDIFNNNASRSERGIDLELSHRNNITQNIIFENFVWGGIGLWNSHDNRVISNNVYSNENGGIRLSNSNGSFISGNTIDSNEIGINLMFVSHENEIISNNISNNQRSGIELISSNGNIFSGNKFDGNGNGIKIDTGSRYAITDNEFIRNENALIINSLDNSTITSNLIADNALGITLRYSVDNIFHHNRFVNNTDQLFRRSSDNTWHDENNEGNYWDDYEGVDTDGDGVGDTDLPHQHVDSHPLTDKRGSPFPFLWIMLIIVVLTVIFVFLFLWFMNKKKKWDEYIEEDHKENESQTVGDHKEDDSQPDEK